MTRPRRPDPARGRGPAVPTAAALARASCSSPPTMSWLLPCPLRSSPPSRSFCFGLCSIHKYYSQYCKCTDGQAPSRLVLCQSIATALHLVAVPFILQEHHAASVKYGLLYSIKCTSTAQSVSTAGARAGARCSGDVTPPASDTGSKRRPLTLTCTFIRRLICGTSAMLE